MQRSRLKNIINKSKELSKPIGEPFDEFKKSLPKELEIDDNYRLEAAWKAYGSPKTFGEALWEGMICPIGKNGFKLPSIGYNEETDEYEYLNKGRESETIAKDIRVWDNDVIPFVKELKHGGYVRSYNETKDCWTYTKNTQKENTLDQEQINIPKESCGEPVDYLKEGGETKKKRNKTDLIIYANQSGVPFMNRILNNDQRKLDFHDGSYGTHLLGYGEVNGKTYVYPQIQENEYKNLQYYKFPEALNRAIENGNVLEMSPEEAEWFTTNYKWFYPNYFGRNPYPNSPQAFKQGGQMTVIPEGALHARKNNMEGAGEDFTAKGIPVVDKEGDQQAEIERDEIIFRKKITDKMEELYKKYNSEESSSKKDEIAIEMGKILTCEITKHTDDRTGLIEEIQNKENG